MSDCCSVKAPTIPAAVIPCPECGSRSKNVDAITVKSLVRSLPFGITPAQYYFCETPVCDVVYFSSNPQAPTFNRDDLLVPVGVKQKHDPVPVCYCFGVSRQDISDEVRRTGKSVVGERIKAEVKAGRCACEVKNPSGKCCLGNVTRAVQEAQKTERPAVVGQ
jgi:CopZ-like zinc binding protein